MSKSELPLLNVFEVETEGVHHHLICFLDVILAGSRGIDSRSVIGQFTPRSGGAFDLESFQVNPAFIEVFVQYMNASAINFPEIIREASSRSSDWLYLLDPRTPGEFSLDPRASDLIGCFAVDDHGQIVPRSFQYNRDHLWFDPVRGVSGVFSDRAFYQWLHPKATRIEG